MTSTLTDRIYGESASVAVKAPCVAVSAGPLPLQGLGAVGGYNPKVDDRILVKDQTDPTANGIYNASIGAWKRSGDFDGVYDAVQGTLIAVTSPTAGGAIFYQLTTFKPIIGKTPLIFSSFINPTSITYPITAAEVLAGVTVANGIYPPGNIERYAINLVPGTTDMAPAVRNALAANGFAQFGIGPYLMGSTIVLTGNKSIIGLPGGGKGSQLTAIVHSAISAGPLFSATSNDFGGIYIGHLDISGGNGSYAIVSAKPQSIFEWIHMEGVGGYNGGGIQLQSGNDGATAPGSWETKIKDCLWVAPAIPTAYRGYDISINGGAVSVERCAATRGSIGFCLNQGATVRFVDCDSGSHSLAYSSESPADGQCGFKFTTGAGSGTHEACEISGCYTEICTQGIQIDDAQGLRISNCLTNDAATFGGGTGILLNAGAQNVTVSNCNITLNYIGEVGIKNFGANTVLENNVIEVLASAVAGTSSYSTTTAMTVLNSLPSATSVARSGYVFTGAPTDINHLISDLTGDLRSFVGTLSGCATAPTGTCTYSINGRSVTLNIPAFSGASNTTGCAILGVPNEIIPAAGTYTMQCTGLDNSVFAQLSAIMAPGSAAITLAKAANPVGFTGAGTKGINASTITYLLN